MVDPTDLTPQIITLADSNPGTPNADNVGLNATWHTIDATDLANGVMFEAAEPPSSTFFILRKESAGELVLTADSNACNQGFSAEHDNVSHVQAGDGTPTTKILGPFNRSRWAKTVTAATNRVTITFSGTTTGTLKCLVLTCPYAGQ